MCFFFDEQRPLVQNYYSWSVQAANLLFVAAGVVSLIMFIVVWVLTQSVSDEIFVILSLLLGCVGYTLLLARLSAPVSIAQFLVGYMLISAAFPLGRATVISLYTKVLPMHAQGSGQGVILAVGAIARILGPFVAVVVFAFDTGGYLVFGSCAMLFVTSLMLFICALPALRKSKMQSSGLPPQDFCFTENKA